MEDLIKSKIREISDWPSQKVLLIELPFLKGRDKLKNYRVNSLVKYES